MIGIRDRQTTDGYKKNAGGVVVDQALSSTSPNPPSNSAVRQAMPFNFGIDEGGNYGYIPIGADSVVPFLKKKYVIKKVSLTNGDGNETTETYVADEEGIYVAVMQVAAPSGGIIFSYTCNGEQILVDEVRRGDDNHRSQAIAYRMQVGDTITFHRRANTADSHTTSFVVVKALCNDIEFYETPKVAIESRLITSNFKDLIISYDNGTDPRSSCVKGNASVVSDIRQNVKGSYMHNVIIANTLGNEEATLYNYATGSYGRSGVYSFKFS